jgi:hypothetical protein
VKFWEGWAFFCVKVLLAGFLRGVSGDTLPRKVHQVVDVHRVDLNGRVIAPRRQPLSVRTPGHTLDPGSVTAQGLQNFARFNISATWMA